MGFTGTVAHAGPTDARCRHVALRVTFGLRGTRRVGRTRRRFPLPAPVPHPVRTR
jgi:hypothetical protein